MSFFNYLKENIRLFLFYIIQIIFISLTIYFDRKNRVLTSNIFYIIFVSMFMFIIYIVMDYYRKSQQVKKLLQSESSKDKTPILPKPIDCKEKIYYSIVDSIYNDFIETIKNIENEFSPEKTHDIWEDSDDIDKQALKEFTEKFIDNSQKGINPAYLEDMISILKNSKGELPWNLYLNRLMGTIESNKKKTITRRNRRQPNRLDLRGELRSHKAEIVVAIDISGSISDEEFKQAIKEVLNIVKNYNHEITIIECDNEIRRVYKVKSAKDVKDRISNGRGTKFTPVFDYANNKNINLLVYFTDGKGENKLQVIPRGYKVLWVISKRGDDISLKESYGAVKKLSKVKSKGDRIDMGDVRNDGYSMNSQAPIL